MKYFIGSTLLVDTGQECATLSPHVYGTFWGGIMILKQHAVLAGLAIALVSLSACRSAQVKDPPPGQNHGREDKREFRIYLYVDPAHPDQCFVDWPVATLWKALNQTVTWVSDDGGDYTVDFGLGANGSPFSQPTFYVPKKGKKSSGDLTQSGKYYDYGIWIGNPGGKPCKQASDPGLYVKP